jgi:hypothetical protein
LRREVYIEIGNRVEPDVPHFRATVKSAYSLAIFLSAFLLFQVELIVGKELLPWFGGAPAVWTTCLVFFQLALLAGYGYSHFVVRRLSLSRQIMVHVVLVGLSVLVLAVLGGRWPSPITPGPSWRPAGNAEPVEQLTILLAATVGIPFFVLSTTGPLLQEWSVTSRPGRSPYRLYALSNAGSLLGLLGYPFLVEPFFGIRTQALVWSGLYLLFAIGVFACAAALWRRRAGFSAKEQGSGPHGGRPSAADVMLWGGLAGVSSALLLSTTNHMCQDTAVIPLLWVLPLSLYLATFILCFRYESLYRRWLIPPLFAAALVYCVVNLFGGLSVSLPSQIAADAAVLFTGCLVCHGELARAKPGVAHLTGFYLAVAAGGAFGGLAVAIAAPRLFNGYWEFPASLWATGAVFIASLFRDRSSFLRRRPVVIASPLFLLLVVLAGALGKQALDANEKARYVTRNFYGLLRVVESSDSTYLKLLHGRITHGFQFTDSARSGIPTSYYGRESGIGLAIESRQATGQGLRIAVVGMGVGTIAAYARENDTVRFYEINPAVPRLSRGDGAFFTYLNNCRGHVEVAMGDARLSLEGELQRGENGRFDVLALDAFSSDAIPVHLLTEEAFSLYLGHLRKPDGILAVHITNRYVDLIPVVHGFAERHGLSSAMISSGEGDEGAWTADWILLSSSRTALARDAIDSAATPWDSTTYRVIRPWTDDYSNMLSLLRPGGADE